MMTLRTIVAACLLFAFAGCVTTPTPADPYVYSPANRITYPQPK
jgi:hypothetical protein